jgi:NADPH:quinone reductase-like Zn-dependent oxidoreductase
MNAAVIYAFDRPPRYSPFEEPVAGDGELIVNVRAAGLHQVVKSRASGKHYTSSHQLPAIPGVDGVGVLEDGSRVYFGVIRPRFGSFAERAVTAKSVCISLPGGLDDVTVAGMMNPAMSSWAPLWIRSLVANKESILILGATGAAGQLAVQIAKRLGARRVVGVGRDPGALEKLKSLGASATISLLQNQEQLVGAFRHEMDETGVDVVLDYVWGRPAEAFLEAVAQRGEKNQPTRARYIQIGSMAGPTITFPAATLRSSGLEMYGSGFGGTPLDDILKSAREFLQETAARPFTFTPIAVPLRDVEKVWSSPQPGGRIVFQP